MARAQLRQDLIRAYERDVVEVRAFIEKHESGTANFENMKSDYERLGHNWQDVVQQFSEEDADELFSDPEVQRVQDEYNDVIGAANTLYHERELSGGRRKHTRRRKTRKQKKRRHTKKRRHIK
jgi:hypothetical protein